MASLAFPELMVKTVSLVFLDPLVHPVPLVHQALLAQVVLQKAVRLAVLDHKAHLVKLVSPVSPVPKVTPVNVVSLVQMVNKVLPASLV